MDDARRNSAAGGEVAGIKILWDDRFELIGRVARAVSNDDLVARIEPAAAPLGGFEPSVQAERFNPSKEEIAGAGRAVARQPAREGEIDSARRECAFGGANPGRVEIMPPVATVHGKPGERRGRIMANLKHARIRNNHPGCMTRGRMKAPAKGG
jgi:hypothetical protein